MNASSACKSVKITREAYQYCLFVQKRYRYKKKWAVNLPSKTSCELALDHFDAFYKPLFGNQWPSVRVSLLSLPKYAAVINNASEPELSWQSLEEFGARDIIRNAAAFVHKMWMQGKLHNEVAPFASREDSISETTVNLIEKRQESDDMLGIASLEKTHPSVGMKLTHSHASDLEKDFEHENRLEHAEDRLHGVKNLLTPDAIQNSADLQYFMPTQQVFSEKEILRQEDYSQSIYQEHSISVSVLPGKTPVLLPSLRVMTFPPGSVLDFPTPNTDKANLLNYYILDAASILPVVALDLQPHDNVLDLCAAPGGKTLSMLQMIISQGGHITSNDSSCSRIRRLKTVLRSYFTENMLSEFVTVTERNGSSFRNPVYNKVLVDVPCNSDRHVLTEEYNNLFKPNRITDRLKLTTMQKELLLAGIKSCKPGGSVVYSTCTLAAVQNEGIVQATIEDLWETSDIDVVVEDLSPMREIFAPVFKFHSNARLGQLVLPSLMNNFGPMYFCKLKRLR